MAFDGPDGYVAGIEALARTLDPQPRLSVSEWAERHRVLPKKSSSQPGRWRNSRFPYSVAIMDALDWRHPAPIVVVTKSSQSGISDAVLNWLGRAMHYEPASFLALWPTDGAGMKWSRSRVAPMMEAIPELARLMPSGRRSAGNTLLEKHYPGGVLYIGSAGKANDVAQISVENVILDDADRMPVTLDKEGDPFELALMRQITFPRKKAVVVSTPTTEETSRVWPLWLSSTMDRYHVPCPHCGHMQHLRWVQLKWLPGNPDGAEYLCESCAALIPERFKTEMLAAGEWRPEHPERENHVKGFHINGLYGPLSLSDPWARHARAWERAQGKPERMQVFFNTRLGEVHRGERQKIEWEEVYRRREPYRLRTVPAGVLILTSMTDVQIDRVETQILGWGRDERVTVIDYVVHWGDPTRHQANDKGEPCVWDLLDAYLAAEIPNSFGVPMRLACSLVDSNYLTDDVLTFARSRRARGIYASRGSNIAEKAPIGRPMLPDVRLRGKIDRRGIERYEIGVSRIKHWLYERLRADAGTPDAPVLPTERHIRFSDELGEEFFRQLTAEIYDPKKGWIARANYHRNEALDTFVGARAAALHHSVALHRLREPDWLRLEQLYESSAAAKAAPTLGRDAIETLGGFLPTVANVKRN